MNQKTKIAIYAICFIMMVTASGLYGFQLGAYSGWKTGYQGALKDISEQAGLDYEWQDLGNGLYNVKIWRQTELQLSRNIRIDSIIQLYRSGELVSSERHAGVLTTIGKNWIEDQLGDSPSTDPAKWIAVDDTDASGLSAASTQLTSELAASGLTRAVGTYASTGDGVWTISKAFSVTGTVSAQTYSLQWVVTSQSDNNMLCYDTSTIKNCVNGDTLTVTFTLTQS